jgi:hypothetical protein
MIAHTNQLKYPPQMLEEKREFTHIKTKQAILNV